MDYRLNTGSLPAAALAGALNEALAEHRAAIVTAPPGSGKSTLLPLPILEGMASGAGKIILLEPRRVAARQIASRLAWMLGERPGETVGYRIRFESKVSARTRIEVVTEGILTRMLLDDPALEGVGSLIFDEFHERSLATDEALALALQCRQLLRDDLRIVIMSATLEADALAASLHCPVLRGEGKMFPVEVVYSKVEVDASHVADLVARTVLGLLSNDEQVRAIAPSAPGRRKVVLATPIAETSLTIEGVRVVVDGGLCRRMVFDAGCGLNHLETVRISLDMAAQRTGRAGRVAPGVCYRLWSKASEARMAPARTPEILSADLASLVLDAAVWGERDAGRLPWITPPSRASLLQARSLLVSLGALDGDGRITQHGRALSLLPCHPRIAQMLLRADTPERKALAADIAALLEEKDPLSGEGDASLDRRLDALRRARREGRPGRWARIDRIARQYAAMLHVREDNVLVNPFETGLLLASAYPERIGKAWKEGVGTFQLSNGDLAALDPSDPLCGEEWLVAASLHRHQGGVGKIFLASPVSPADLEAFTSTRDTISWDAKAGTVMARKEVRVGAILLGTSPLAGDIRDRVKEVICQALVKDGLSMLSFSDAVQNLQRRIAFVAARHPELELPDVSSSALCGSAPQWGPLFIGRATTVQELRKIDLCEVVWSRLSYAQQQAVEKMAPTHVIVPTGSRIALEYRAGAEAPVLRVRLQECFGLLDTPQADGVPVLMELLSPGFKPVQLTSDLRSFWEGTYFEVRKELRRRYPKHAWPEKPLEADPVRGRKK